MASPARPPSNVIGEWTRMKKLGQGGFGSVYIGKRNDDGKLFAVKSVYFVPQGISKDDPRAYKEELENEECALFSLINEIRTLKKLRSQYIVSYFGCGTSNPPELGGRLVLDCYIEYCPRGCLWDVMLAGGGSIDEPFIKSYAMDILYGLAYLHFNKIVHGDLKCSNVLMGTTQCKIADFGSVKDTRTSLLSKLLIGTPGFRAPEVIYGVEQTFASDIFSLGCTMLEMTTGNCFSPTRTTHGTRQPEKPRVIPDHLSDDCRSFISACLIIDPVVRWTAVELISHPFVATPASPQHRPYDIPIETKLEDQILNPPDPSELDDYTGGPISPIVPPPEKRRRLMPCGNVDERYVAVPSPPRWRSPDREPSPRRSQGQKSESERRAKESASPDHMQNTAANEQDGGKRSHVKSPPRYQPEPKRDSGKNRFLGTHAALAAIRGLKEERVQAQKSNKSKGTTYRGHKVSFGPSAQMEEPDEDKDPFVVKICEEFEIRLPKEYQKWILDPDYDPDDVKALATSIENYLTSIARGVKRVGRKGLGFFFGNRP